MIDDYLTLSYTASLEDARDTIMFSETSLANLKHLNRYWLMWLRSSGFGYKQLTPMWF
jgi:hypothetical protein